VTLHYDSDRDDIMVSDGGGPVLRDDILALVKREIAAEREACARLAEQITGRRRVMRSFADAAEIKPCPIAAAIRARGEATT